MKLVFFITLTSLIGVQFIFNQSTELNVCSKAKGRIDSVRILSYGVREVFKNLQYDVNQNRKVKIEIPPDVREGGFTIVVYRKDSVLNATGFGYYTSYLDIQDSYNIIIQEDFTVSVK